MGCVNNDEEVIWLDAEEEEDVLSDEEIINWLDSGEDWASITAEIATRCDINEAFCVVMRIVRDFGYNRSDVYTPELFTEYRIAYDLSEELEELCESEDCKNGCQLMREPDGTYYFQITGSNFYDKEDNYAGTDTVKVYFKEFIW